LPSKHTIIYSPKYEVNIGNHVFPTSKYRLIKENLINKYNLPQKNFKEPSEASPGEVMKVHTEKYVMDIKNGSLSLSDELRLELPYSKELAEAAFLCCGGTVSSCNIAEDNGVGFHLGGGFHHAYPDHGEGFCVFNDVALGAKHINLKGKKVLVIDCDLHQGNGTAFIFKTNPDVFTFSIHQYNNYPVFKEKSDLDVELEDGATGRVYNELLEKSLKDIMAGFKPDFAVYVAGSDPYKNDKLGGLGLSISELAERDEIVKSATLNKNIPVAVTLAGGYAIDISDTVEIHSNTAAVFLEL